MIKAKVQSDDLVHLVEFDATSWFSQASEEAIANLAACGFGGDYAADEVALYYEENAEIGELFSHCSSKPYGMGFECYVDEDSAMVWLKVNRPELAEVI